VVFSAPHTAHGAQEKWYNRGLPIERLSGETGGTIQESRLGKLPLCGFVQQPRYVRAKRAHVQRLDKTCHVPFGKLRVRHVF